MIKISPFIYVNLTSASCCFFFLIFLLIAYFSRKNMNNVDNTIYKHMLILNLLTTLFFVLYYIFDLIAAFSPDYRTLYPVVYFFSKLAPQALVYWAWFFVLYVYYITHEKDNEFSIRFEKNKTKYFKRMYIFLGIITIFHFMEHWVVDLSTGVEDRVLITMNISLNLALLVGVILVIKNRKNLDKKKALPAFSIVPIIALAMLGGIIGVPIVLLYIMITAIDHLMYHTIENPDIQLINELELAKNQAEQSNNAKSDFLSSMSHELRTPLNAIVGLSQMIQTTTQEEETKNDINDIMKASKNLLELVDGILDINKLEANEMKLNNSNYNPREIFEDLGKMIKIRIGDKPIEYRARISDTLPTTLYGDKDKIKSIVLNLLTNAVKYTDQGYIDFGVDSMIVKGKCNLRISVSDTGRGISEDQMPYMFTKFYRREEDKDSDIEGTGLGLAITKSLVDLMDGKITINSSEGMGSTFLVILAQEIIEDKEEIVETL